MPCLSIQNGDFRLPDYLQSIALLIKEPTVTLDLFKIGQRFTGKYFDYVDTTILSDTGTVAVAIGAADTNIDVGALKSALGVGVIIEIGDEQMFVSSISTAGNTVDVLRGHGGTAAVAHVAGASIYVLSQAQKESGCSTNDCKAPVKTPRRNVLQEMTECYCLSGRSARFMANGGLKDYVSEDELLMDAMERMLQRLNKALMYSTFDDTSVDGAWTFRGIRSFINTYGGVVHDAGGAALSTDIIDCALAALNEKTTFVDTLLMNAKVKAAFNKLPWFQPMLPYGTQGNTVGNDFDFYRSSHLNKKLKVVVDNKLYKDEIYVLDSESLYIHPEQDVDGTDYWFKDINPEDTNCDRTVTIASGLTTSVLQPDRQGYITNFTLPWVVC